MTVVKKGLRLLGVVLAYHVISALLLNTLWMFPPVLTALSVLSFGYLALWFLYGWLFARVGFWRGLAVGVLGVLPGLILLALSLLTLATSGMREGGPLWVMVPWSYPLLPILNTLPHMGWVSQFLPHMTVPLSVLLTGLGSWAGSRKVQV